MPRDIRMILGGRSWHVALRPRADRDRRLSGTLALHSAGSDHNQRGPQPVRHDERVQKARVLRLLPRSSERSGALARARQKPANSGRPQLARRTATARRRRDAARLCSAFAWRTDRPQPARHGARAQQARVVHQFPRNSERSGALASATRTPGDFERQQVARRTKAARRRREACRLCSALACCMKRPQSPRHGTCAQQDRVLRLLPIDSERSGAPACATQRPADSVSGRR